MAGAKWGSAVVSADFNKDGFADLAVGAPFDKVSGVAGGTVSVFNGTSSGLSTSGTRFTQTNVGASNEADDQFGWALAAGDFNKDTFPDLAIGAPNEAIGATKAGVVGFMFGSTTGLKNGRFIDQTELGGGNEASDQFGYALTAGDFNADGFADVAIGMPGEKVNTVKSGLVLVGKGFSGFFTAGSNIAGYMVGEGDASGTNEANDKFGNALAAGNVTGGTHADLVVGAPGKGLHSFPANSGAVFVVPGAASGKSAGFYLAQTDAGDQIEGGDTFGGSVTVGNIDGGTHLEIVAGAPGEAVGTATTTGAVSVFFGPKSGQEKSGFTVTENLAAETLRSGDKFGTSVAVGDVDDNGFGDLVVGAPGRTLGSATAAGAVYLFGGHQRGSGAVVNLSPGRVITQSGIGEADETNDAFGAAVAVGDVNNDRNAEALIGASGEAPTGQPASGVAVAVSGLVACGSVPVVQNTRVTAMQIAPQGGASQGTLEYAYVDNIGRLVHGHQTNLDDFGSLAWQVISDQLAFSGQPGLGQQQDARLQMIGRNIDGAQWTNTQTAATPPVFDHQRLGQPGRGLLLPAGGREGERRQAVPVRHRRQRRPVVTVAGGRERQVRCLDQPGRRRPGRHPDGGQGQQRHPGVRAGHRRGAQDRAAVGRDPVGLDEPWRNGPERLAFGGGVPRVLAAGVRACRRRVDPDQEAGQRRRLAAGLEHGRHLHRGRLAGGAPGPGHRQDRAGRAGQRRGHLQHQGGVAGIGHLAALGTRQLLRGGRHRPHGVHRHRHQQLQLGVRVRP